MDSPPAVETIHIYGNDMTEYYDDETLELVKKGVNPIYFDGLKVAVTSDESRMINDDKNPKVILSASGMCEAGRIRHHLKHNLWRAESTILFVGYQAVGTLGRNRRGRKSRSSFRRAHRGQGAHRTACRNFRTRRQKRTA